MEQRYLIEQDLDAGTFTLKEMAETDVGKYTILHHRVLDLTAVQGASAKGADAVVALVRNHDFFPIEFAANFLANGIIELVGGTETSAKLHFCDNDALPSHQAEEAAAADKDPIEVDDLLEEDDPLDEGDAPVAGAETTLK